MNILSYRNASALIAKFCTSAEPRMRYTVGGFLLIQELKKSSKIINNGPTNKASLNFNNKYMSMRATRADFGKIAKLTH